MDNSELRVEDETQVSYTYILFFVFLVNKFCDFVLQSVRTGQQ